MSHRQGSHPRAPLSASDDLDRLLGAVARGEHGAFDVVYGQLRDPIRNQVRAVLRDPALSDEVTQDVLLELWRTAVRYDPDKGSATAWALTIARRRAVDRVRRTAAATARDQQAALPAPGWDQIHETVQDTLDRERLVRCLAQLSDLQREAIALTFYGGRTHNEAAEILGAPLGTVKARIRDALIKLRYGMLADDVGDDLR